MIGERHAFGFPPSHDALLSQPSSSSLYRYITRHSPPVYLYSSLSVPCPDLCHLVPPAMSEDMPPSSWRSLASAAGRSLKGYVAQQRELKQSYPSWRGTPPQDSDATPKKQSWGQWAGQKLRRGSQSEYDVSGDRITIFPGWATRRYREPQRDGQEGTSEVSNISVSCASSNVRADAQFDIDVFVSGYTCKLTGVGFNTKAGRAFLRLAKSTRSFCLSGRILTLPQVTPHYPSCPSALECRQQSPP